MKTRLSLASLCVPLALLFAGCGADATGASEAAASAPAVAERAQALNLDASVGHEVRIGSVWTGKCLSTSNGAVIHATIREYSNCGGSMRFVLLRGIVGGTYKLQAAGTNLCVDVSNGTLNGGEQLQLFTCLNQGNQSFLFDNAQIKPQNSLSHNPVMCWDVPVGPDPEGAYIQQYGCHTGDNQKWRVFDITTNSYIF